ncbi:MAG: arginase family protein [Stackebrandtia sp.]
MPIVYVPYHLDEYLPDLDVPLPSDAAATELNAELPEGDVWSRLVSLYGQIADVTERTARAGSMPTVVSGDCTVMIGMAAGLRRAGIDPAIVWLDAHGDLQTFETTPSGYLGGMALRLLMGYRAESMLDRLGLRPVPADRVMLVDARDLDPAEAEYIDSSPLRHVPLAELTPATLPAGPLLVNIDLDTVDPAELAGLRYPAEGGPNVPTILRAARTILDSGQIAGLNIACTWTAGHGDPDGTRARLVSTILETARQQAGLDADAA